MLVLERKIGQRIVIGGNIEISLVTIRGKRVRLAINAPSYVPIQRGEVPAGAREVRQRRLPVAAAPEALAEDATGLAGLASR